MSSSRMSSWRLRSFWWTRMLGMTRPRLEDCLSWLQRGCEWDVVVLLNIEALTGFEVTLVGELGGI